jgi:hypothetical protein
MGSSVDGHSGLADQVNQSKRPRAAVSSLFRSTQRPDVRPEWARLGSNQRPPACEAGALPLSYAPRPTRIPPPMPAWPASAPEPSSLSQAA